MKKYAIIVGEGNEELSLKTQKALSAVGIGFQCRAEPDTEYPVLFISGGFLSIGELTDIEEDEELLWPSFVIEHAVDLAGAEETDKANAQLIAAAPDLLEALKKAQTGLSIATGLIEHAFDKDSIFVEEAFKAVNEAIAKAEGEPRK
jgi:hypothetical protein